MIIKIKVDPKSRKLLRYYEKLVAKKFKLKTRHFQEYTELVEIKVLLMGFALPDSFWKNLNGVSINKGHILIHPSSPLVELSKFFRARIKKEIKLNNSFKSHANS